jgi:transposase
MVQVLAVKERGHALPKRQLKQSQVTAFLPNLPPCLIGMEAGWSDVRPSRELRFSDSILPSPNSIYTRGRNSMTASLNRQCEAR